MITWKRELQGLKDETVERLSDVRSEIATNYSLNAKGRQQLKRTIRRFGAEEVLEAMHIAGEQYLEYDSEDAPTKESVEIAWSKVSGICAPRRRQQSKQL